MLDRFHFDVPEGRPRDDRDAKGAEYWRREADRLQLAVNELRGRVEELTAPITMFFRGVENGVAYERTVIRVPEEHWEPEVERNPDLISWDWTATGGLLYLVSPTLRGDD